MSAKTILLESKYGSWGWPDPKLMQAVDESYAMTIRLALGQAQIERIVIKIGARQYNFYPEGEQPIAYVGEVVQVLLYIKNIGDTATIFAQLSSPEVSEFSHTWGGITNYYEMVALAGQILSPLDFGTFYFEMPNSNVNLTIEVGHV